MNACWLTYSDIYRVKRRTILKMCCLLFKAISIRVLTAFHRWLGHFYVSVMIWMTTSWIVQWSTRFVKRATISILALLFWKSKGFLALPQFTVSFSEPLGESIWCLRLDDREKEGAYFQIFTAKAWRLQKALDQSRITLSIYWRAWNVPALVSMLCSNTKASKRWASRYERNCM